MAEKKSYFELLKDPRWQKKKYEVLKWNDFTCENCGDKETTLHAHHSYYEWGVMPWEYPTESLHCVCENCHPGIQNEMKEFKKQQGRLSLDSLQRLAGYAAGLEAADCPLTVIDMRFRSLEFAQGLAACWGTTDDEIFRSLDKNCCINGFRLSEIEQSKSPLVDGLLSNPS